MHKIRLLLLVLTVLLLSFEDAYTAVDRIKFNHVRMGRGLFQNVINCIYQDSEGFIWFGTQDGLIKYDGYDFKEYKSVPFDSTSLTDNWVQAIAEDASGDLWIGTYSGGLFEFNRNNETFKNYRHIPKDNNSLISNRIWTIKVSGQNIIWIGTAAGLDKYDKSSGKFIHYTNIPGNPNSLSNNAVNAILDDGKGCLWLGTWGGGLNKLDTRKNVFYRYLLGEDDRRISGDNFIKTIVGDGNYLWIGSKRSLMKFNKANGNVKKYFLDNKIVSYPDENSVLSLLIDKNKRLWIGTHNNGLYILNLKTGKINNYRYSYNDPDGIRDNWISVIFKDIQGIYWIGTGKGIDKLLPYSKYFTHFGMESGPGYNLSSNEINSIFADHNGTVWIGTWNGGLDRYNPRTGKIRFFKHSLYDPDALLNNTVWSVFEDSDNTLWIGTYAGLTTLDRKTGKFITPRFLDKMLSNHNISSIYEDSRHFLWIGTWGGGLYKYDKKKNTIRSFKFDPKDNSSLSDNLVTCIYEDHNKNLWIGTNAGGLNLFNYRNGSFLRFQYNPGNVNSISNNNVSSVYQDSEGNLWIGTWGGGLNQLDLEAKTFTHYTEKNGLANNIIMGILEDSNNYLWLSTKQGLSRFSLKTRLFINYDSKDGLGNDQFGHGYFKFKDGHMMFGGLNGISVVYPDSIKINTYRPTVTITSFKIFSHEREFDKEISVIKNIHLKYYEHDFTIEFSGLDYSRPDKDRYAYMLEGYNENWIDIGNERSAHYTNMEPGKYVFEVKAANRDNYWSKKPATLIITIIPPFWKTWPFFILMILAFLALIYMLHKYRVQQLLKLERMRTSIATDLHDDIGASLTRISLFSDAALRSLKKLSAAQSTDKNENHPLKNIQYLLTEIGDNSRRLIGSMSDIVWTVNPQNDSFENITIRMMDFTAKLFEVKEIDYKITVDPDLSDLSLPMDFRRNMFLIYKEGISNIVRHAGATQVEVNVLKENGNLILIIEDNGIGFENNGSGNGLRNIKKRTASFGGNLEVTSRSGKGTRLKAVLKLP